MTKATTKVTLTTVKGMIKRGMESGKLKIQNHSSFDGMTDCVQTISGSTFRKAEKSTRAYSAKNDLGVAGLWVVGNSRDYFDNCVKNADGKLVQVRIYNCCGSMTLKLEG